LTFKEQVSVNNQPINQKMKKTFFIKYLDYRTGLRFVIFDGGGSHCIEHNKEKQPGDEVFAKGFESLLALQRRLKELYPERNFLGHGNEITAGEIHFTYLFQDILRLAERVKRKYPKKKK